MITRRNFLRGLGLSAVAGTLAVAGCAPGGPNRNPAGGDGGLRFAWWGNDVRSGLTRQAIDLFQQQNPDIKVSGEPGDFGGYWDKLATTTAGGDAPDVMQQVDPYIIEYAQRGALADLREFSSVLDLAPYDEAVIAPSTIDGKVYGLPSGITATAFWVNPAVLKELGEPMPDDSTWTWDDFAALSERLAKKSSGKVNGTGQLSFDEQSFTVFVRQHGQQLWAANKIGFSKDVLVEWWNYVLQLQERKAAIDANASVESQGASIEVSPIVTGKVAFSYGWANQLSQAQTAGKVALQLLQLPGDSTATQRGMFVKPSQHFSISARSANTEAGAKLINFLLNTTDAGNILLTDRGIPANPTVLEAIQSKLNDGDKKATAHLKTLTDLGLTPVPVPPAGASEITKAFPRYTQNVLFKQQSVDAAADEFIGELESAIA